MKIFSKIVTTGIIATNLAINACICELQARYMNKIDVANFGAIANDGKDDTEAVLKAIEHCKKVGHNILFFPKGKYDFFAGSNPKSPRYLFPFDGYKDLTIDGGKSEFLIHGLTGVFIFANCNNLTVKNFSIDWDRPFFSTGKVTSVDNNHFDVEVFPEYPVKGGEPVGAYMSFDPETRLPERRGADEYYTVEKTELLREQVLRIYTKNKPPIKPGVLVVLRHQVYGPGTFHFSRCRNSTVKDVNVFHTPGMGLTASVCTDFTLLRFKVVPKPGSGHLMSATADATHFSGCKGILRMENCEYEGMGDDGVNIKSGLYLTMKEKIDAHTIIGSHNLKIVDAPDVGDVLEIIHTDDLVTYATVTVKEVEIMANDGLQKLTFEEELPEGLKAGDLFGNASRTAKVRINKVEVRKNRARGLLIQTRDVVVENCKFSRCTSSGVMVFTESVFFFESIGTRNVTIRNCIFDNCNYAAANSPGSLSVFAFLKDFKLPVRPGVHKDVVLESNKIYGTDYCGIFAAGVDGLKIVNNHIENACGHSLRDFEFDAIHLIGSKNVVIEGNVLVLDKDSPRCKRSVGFGEGVDQSTIKIGKNCGF